MGLHCSAPAPASAATPTPTASSSPTSPTLTKPKPSRASPTSIDTRRRTSTTSASKPRPRARDENEDDADTVASTAASSPTPTPTGTGTGTTTTTPSRRVLTRGGSAFSSRVLEDATQTSSARARAASSAASSPTSPTTPPRPSLVPGAPSRDALRGALADSRKRAGLIRRLDEQHASEGALFLDRVLGLELEFEPQTEIPADPASSSTSTSTRSRVAAELVRDLVREFVSESGEHQVCLTRATREAVERRAADVANANVAREDAAANADVDELLLALQPAIAEVFADLALSPVVSAYLRESVSTAADGSDEEDEEEEDVDRVFDLTSDLDSVGTGVVPAPAAA